MCEEIVKIKELRNYYAFSEDAEKFYFIYDFCIKNSLTLNNYLENLESVEDFLYKFRYYTFPFSIIFTDSTKALKFAEELAIDGKIVDNLLLTKISGKNLYIPKLKAVGNKVYLYDENIKEFDEEKHVKISNKTLVFFRLLNVFDYKLFNGFEYFLNENFAFFEKSFLKKVSLLSEDLLNIYANYKQISEEKKFFLEEISKLVLSAKLSGFRFFNYNLLFVSKDKDVVFYIPGEFPVNDLIGTEKISIDNFPIELRKQEFIDIENITLVKFKEIKYFSPHLLRFLKAISSDREGVLDA
jgi:hypothetical protein